MTLEVCRRDFESLIDRFKMQREYERNEEGRFVCMYVCMYIHVYTVLCLYMYVRMYLYYRKP